ncbi:MAG: purine-binding chemotaxis protein CheW [Aquificae bacterium]|nr:purine-binding chemotaxis protein CheW [Aquificota bacterium]
MSEMEVVGIKEVTAEKSTEKRLITFKLNDELIGIDIINVVKITIDMDITPVPKTKDYILGVMNLRGNIIPVVTLKRKLELPETYTPTRNTIIVVETDFGNIGLLVDKVEGALNVDPENVQPPPMNSIGIDPEFIEGVIMFPKENEDKELLTILNIKKIFKADNL